MPEFISLKPKGLPKEFTWEAWGETPYITVEEKEDRIEINYIFPGFIASDREREVEGKPQAFKQVSISGAGFVELGGRPMLPRLGRFVRITPGCAYKFGVTTGKPVIIDDILIIPAQEMAAAAAPEYDHEAYQSDALYPAELVEVGEPQNLDGRKALPVYVCPLQYNAAKRRLIGYGNITVTFRLSPSKELAADWDEFSLCGPPIDLEGFGNLVLNPVWWRGEDYELVGPVGPGQQGIYLGPELLIIYDKALQEAAGQLANWKNNKGLATETVSISEVGNSPPEIKAYIRAKRGAYLSILRYVLLLGDVNAIRTEERHGVVTDHYYYTKTDPAGSSDCLLPWVSGGRIPVKSPRSARSVVDKIINYERNPPENSDYYKRMTFASYFQDESPQDHRADNCYLQTMEEIRDHLDALGFAVERVYVPKEPQPKEYMDMTRVQEDVVAAMMREVDATEKLRDATNESRLIIAHRGPGDESGWVHPPFTTDHVSDLKEELQSIFFSISDRTGRFNLPDRNCFAELLLKHWGSANSTVAPTGDSTTRHGDSLIKALFDALWPGLVRIPPPGRVAYRVKYNRLGDVLNYAKAYLLLMHGENSVVKRHLEIYHVLGDPTLQVYTEPPRSLAVHCLINRGTLYIALETVPAGARLAICHRNAIVMRCRISTNLMSLPLSSLHLGHPLPPPLGDYLLICVSAPGYRYSQTRVDL